ncbi:MAG: tripartite tricarboxylate transporter substrate binding protein [Betaproteobacteria bacterium]|nr:tripartite tricarboxylate transporter substrate binding protein [Betaproteobacteria bacterium]
MKPIHRRFLVALGIAALAGAASGQAVAQGYPAGPVRVVVPFPPGGGVDSMGRILGQKLTEALGKQIIIENRPGANGMIGSEIVAKSAKDGYTLLVNGANFVTTPSLYSNVTYDPIKDFDPVSLVAHAPNVLVVHPSLPAKSVKELFTLAKARPGQVHYASSASGSTPHLAAELFKTMTRTDLLHVPYRGTGPAITALLSGEVSVMFMPAIAAVPHVKSGRLRALGVTTLERLPAMPDLPTVAETGLRGYQSSQWYGVLAPAGTPGPVLSLLNSHVAKIMQNPEMKRRMTDSGSLAVGSTREQFAFHLKEEFAKWAKVIKASGARVD